ncbi:glycosyltransferase [Halegenticoccus tardaugens]|uniref:glycosyltransferase n=1 Tax=Halegenticoccus tardaugens TaxID=2071624 RepID=UPI00100A353C|nr:glycosyltransferase [Halegenticoccus tardaugens]
MVEPTRAEPTVSVVVPARNEEAYLPEALSSVRSMDTEVEYELLVVDGASGDATREIAESYGAAVYDNRGRGIGDARHLGATRARGEWYAFVDADTTVRPDYLDEMLSFVRERNLVAASSRCRMPGLRPKPMQATINRVFPRLDPPILPGFNFFVAGDAYHEVGGFPNVPNEDTAFSRRLGAYGETAYHPGALVETSPRRIRESGLTGTLYHYLKLDWGRYRADY